MEKIEKGWGYELVIVNKSAYCGKLLHFKAGSHCSWHYHLNKDETFYLHSGLIKLYIGESDYLADAKEVILKPGDSYYIYPGLRHQMVAEKESDLYEFSTEHFESDSIRIIKGD